MAGCVVSNSHILTNDTLDNAGNVSLACLQIILTNQNTNSSPQCWQLNIQQWTKWNGNFLFQLYALILKPGIMKEWNPQNDMVITHNKQWLDGSTGTEDCLPNWHDNWYKMTSFSQLYSITGSIMTTNHSPHNYNHNFSHTAVTLTMATLCPRPRCIEMGWWFLSWAIMI